MVPWPFLGLNNVTGVPRAKTWSSINNVTDAVTLPSIDMALVNGGDAAPSDIPGASITFGLFLILVLVTGFGVFCYHDLERRREQRLYAMEAIRRDRIRTAVRAKIAEMEGTESTAEVDWYMQHRNKLVHFGDVIEISASDMSTQSVTVIYSTHEESSLSQYKRLDINVQELLNYAEDTQAPHPSPEQGLGIKQTPKQQTDTMTTDAPFTDVVAIKSSANSRGPKYVINRRPSALDHTAVKSSANPSDASYSAYSISSVGNSSITSAADTDFNSESFKVNPLHVVRSSSSSVDYQETPNDNGNANSDCAHTSQSVEVKSVTDFARFTHKSGIKSTNCSQGHATGVNQPHRPLTIF